MNAIVRMLKQSRARLDILDASKCASYKMALAIQTASIILLGGRFEQYLASSIFREHVGNFTTSCCAVTAGRRSSWSVHAEPRTRRRG